MGNSNHRLAITLCLAFIAHIAFLYPTPELIPIPLTEPSYSVEVELTNQKASSNSKEVAEEAEKDQIESSASEDSKAVREQLEEASTEVLQEQAGSQKSHIREDSKSAKVSIQPNKESKTKLDDTTTARTSNKTLQELSDTATDTVGKEDSDVVQVMEEVIQKEEVKASEIAASKAQNASENSKASSQKSVKSEDTPTPPVLTVTEQYEAQIYAWILTGPNSRIFGGGKILKQPVTIQATWWRNGTVIFAKVHKSSGDPAADAAAKRTVLSASPFPKIPDDIQGKEYTLDITLQYFDN